MIGLGIPSLYKMAKSCFVKTDGVRFLAPTLKSREGDWMVAICIT